ncbi:sensor histidine kinase [Microbacterium aurum]|uniref:sensor histidine kinase n=1 Tax=Microbacterium aurum TaxID=36805 RepID=UPI001EF4DE24|nr:histidine kinase [Microbacterium aurum]
MLQLVGILTAMPAFFAPAEVVPAGAVVFAALGSLLNVTAFALILVDQSTVLVYSAAIIIVVAIYAGAVAVVSLLVPPGVERTVQTVAAIGIALLFQPVVGLLRRTVGRTLYGGRDDPAGTARRVRQRHDGSEAGVAAAVAETAELLRLPGLTLVVDGKVVAIARRTAADVREVEIPISTDGSLALRVVLRPGERALHADDRAALELVALPLALLAREADLSEQLRDARAATVESREWERVTLHRDLHDGLGPLLTGAAFRADAARNLLRSHPDAVDAQLEVVQADLRTALEEVRRVVDGLRPIELQDRGLWDALARRADRVGADLDVPDPPPVLTAAGQVAVYRIVSEALTNADRHGHGSPTDVSATLTPDGALHLVVQNPFAEDTPRGDNARAPGGSTSAPARPGIGVASIHARAEELGGSATIGSDGHGLWRVTVHLPPSVIGTEPSPTPRHRGAVDRA